MAVSSEMDTSGAGKRIRMSDIRAIEKKSGPAAAERAVIEFLRGDPRSTQAFVALSRLLMKQEKFEDATRAAEKARSLAPLEVEPVVAHAFVHMRQKNFDKAGQIFAEAISLDSTSTRAHLGAAGVKYAQEDYAGALEIAERTLKIDPASERAEELKARAHMKLGNKAEAINTLQYLVAQNPGNDRALKSYIRIMRAEDRGEEAYRFIEQDTMAHPEDRKRALRLAKVALRSGKADVAVEQTRRLAEGANGRPDDKIRYISTLIEAERFAEAETAISRLGEARIYEPVANKLRGDIALKAGDASKAIDLYRTTCKRARVDPLTSAAEAAATTPEEKAKLWRSHTRKVLGTLIQERRQDRG